MGLLKDFTEWRLAHNKYLSIVQFSDKTIQLYRKTMVKTLWVQDWILYTKKKNPYFCFVNIIKDYIGCEYIVNVLNKKICLVKNEYRNITRMTNTRILFLGSNTEWNYFPLCVTKAFFLIKILFEW